MATLSSPLPSPLPPSQPDATTPPTSSTPALTPSPAATSPSPSPASGSLSVAVTGRSKAQRWCRDTPPSGKSGGGVPPFSYKEALLTEPTGASTGLPAPPPTSIPSRPAAPRIVVLPADTRSRRPKPGPDADGWQEAESRRSRKARLRAERGPLLQLLLAESPGDCLPKSASLLQVPAGGSQSLSVPCSRHGCSARVDISGLAT
ncbi:unnamed protein product [Urochloa humidicola]